MTIVTPRSTASQMTLGEATACLMHGFSDRSRLAIVGYLLEGEHRVVDLTQKLGLAQSTVSKHLACLLDCSIVQVRSEGRASIYTLSHPKATQNLFEAANGLLALTGNAVANCDNFGTRSGGTR